MCKFTQELLIRYTRFYGAFREIGKPFLKLCNSEKVESGAKTVPRDKVLKYRLFWKVKNTHTHMRMSVFQP